MNRYIHSNEDWSTALKAGFSLINKSGIPGDVEDDLGGGRLAAIALLMGAPRDWLFDCLAHSN